MRFEDKFPGQATAQVALAKIIALMELGLENLSKINEGEDARVSIPPMTGHEIKKACLCYLCQMSTISFPPWKASFVM